MSAGWSCRAAVRFASVAGVSEDWGGRRQDQVTPRFEHVELEHIAGSGGAPHEDEAVHRRSARARTLLPGGPTPLEASPVFDRLQAAGGVAREEVEVGPLVEDPFPGQGRRLSDQARLPGIAAEGEHAARHAIVVSSRFGREGPLDAGLEPIGDAPGVRPVAGRVEARPGQERRLYRVGEELLGIVERRRVLAAIRFRLDPPPDRRIRRHVAPLEVRAPQVGQPAQLDVQRLAEQ
jgi:hypothetical protein